MPIEIRELVIRATVDPHSTGRGSGSCGASGTSGGTGAAGAAGSGPRGGGAASGASGASDDVVQSCVREVMRMLEQKRER
jgi:hypothetical protein